MKKSYRIAAVTTGALATNCYIFTDVSTGKAIIIDPGDEPEKILAVLRKNGCQAVGIVNTHGHTDHIGADRALKEALSVPLYIHRADAEYLGDASLNGSYSLGQPLTAPTADVLLDEGSIIPVGGLSLTVYATPGHTPGGIILKAEDALFTGDTLFRGTVGRTDLPGGDERALMQSLRKFRKFSGEMTIFPGHGPSSTLDEEFRKNPYLAE